MKLQEKQVIFSGNVGALLDYIIKMGFRCTLGEAYRTAEQATLYAQQGKGIKNSLHCKRLAIDLNLFDRAGTYLKSKESYQLFGDYWKSLHPKNRWGGDFEKLVDSNHFEMQDI
jgi:hypothetical protein